MIKRETDIKAIMKNSLHKYGVVFAFILLCIVVSIITPKFLQVRNLMNILRQYSVIGILSVGMTLVIISGNFDISVGYICGFCGALLIKLNGEYGVALLPAVVIVLLVGALIGCVNGFCVARIGIPSMIATLGMGEVVNGAFLLITGGYSLSIANETLRAVGKGSVIGVPTITVIFLLTVILFQFILKKTRYGRSTYAVGGNIDAARLSGIKTKQITISAFAICGLLAALSGIVLTARVMNISPASGSGYELDAIAAVVIGETRVSGGEGNVWRTVMGVLFVGVISNALNLLGVNDYYQYILKGGIILLAVGTDCLNRMKRRR